MPSSGSVPSRTSSSGPRRPARDPARRAHMSPASRGIAEGCCLLFFVFFLLFFSRTQVDPPLQPQSHRERLRRHFCDLFWTADRTSIADQRIRFLSTESRSRARSGWRRERASRQPGVREPARQARWGRLCSQDHGLRGKSSRADFRGDRHKSKHRRPQ